MNVVPAISTRELCKVYGSTVALDHLTLDVDPGEIFGFLGPNGSGKTTTIRLLLGFIRPTSGDARVMGVPVGDGTAAHRHLGYVSGDVALWPQLTGRQTLDLLGSVGGNTDTNYRDELCERLGLDPSRRLRTYSKGNRQKVALVAAFMTRPSVLLLDEPTAGLDPLMEREFQAIVRECADRGQTVFLSSHILDEVQDLCGRVGILRDGRLVEVATLDELRRIGGTVVEIHFDGEAPPLGDVPGVVDFEAIPGVAGGVRMTVTGSIQPLIETLSRHPVLRMRTLEPSLEEVFLSRSRSQHST